MLRLRLEDSFVYYYYYYYYNNYFLNSSVDQTISMWVAPFDMEAPPQNPREAVHISALYM